MTFYSLHIGINQYPGTDMDLSGCVNDAHDWQSAMTDRGSLTPVTLTDELATKAAIERAVEELVGSLSYGETGVITYSGHGTWVPDVDGDEQDGRDEALVPYDVADAGPLLDDTLYRMFSTCNGNLVMISDSCHSGTLARLMSPLNPARIQRHRKARFLPPSTFLASKDMRLASAVQNVPPSLKSRQSALLLAACRDSEVAYDAWFGRRANGAFTRVALDALPGKRSTYRSWHQRIRQTLPSVDYPQTPQLWGSAGQKSGYALL